MTPEEALKDDEDGKDNEDVSPPVSEEIATPADSYVSLFSPRSFGGELVWAEAQGYTAKILRVQEGQNVLVSIQGRRDMVVLLTGGRAVLEVRHGSDVEQTELPPATPTPILDDRSYRLIALSEVELFTIFTKL